MEKTTKLLGGWGYIALVVGGFLGFLGPFSFAIIVAGMVCVLIAFYRAGSELNLPSIKRDITIAIVLNIVAYVLFLFIVGSAFIAYFAHVGHMGNADTDTGAAAALGAGTIFAAFLAWVLIIVGCWFWYKASQAMTDGTGVGTYKTGGLLIFIGSITVIVFFIGFLVMWIGEIIQTVAFFSTQEKGPDSLEPPSASAS
jgi:uncharacterized membrane protein